jgi:RsiW-degrading membrane proteinase PrsW (M82 family)
VSAVARPPVTFRSGRRWAIAAALLAGATCAWPTYVRYFGLHPGPMLAGLAIAFAMYLPSLWVIGRLDRAEPEPRAAFWGAILFVVLFAPITSRVMHAVIDAGAPYWAVVGPFEETTKLLPLLLLAVAVPGIVTSMRDGLVYGALGGLGFAIVEFGANFALSGYPASGWADLATAIPGRWALGTESHVIWGATAGAGVGYLLARRGRGGSVPIALGIVALVMATHGFNDLYGKYVGPLSLVLLDGPARAAGVDLGSSDAHPALAAALLVYAAVANTLVVNLALWPVLLWAWRRSGREERDGTVHSAVPAGSLRMGEQVRS